MLFLHKLLPIFILPTGLACILLALALLLRRWLFVAAALAILYVASMPVVGEALIGRLENRYPLQTVAGCAPADAVVVLGGVLGYNRAGMDFLSWGDAVDRFTVGVALMRAGKANFIVFSRAKIPWLHQTQSEGELLRPEAIAAGIPAEKILLTGQEVHDTADEARAAAALCREHGWKHVLLVTSAWHMPRAAWLFRRAGVDFTAFPVNFLSDPGRPLTALDFLPDPIALMTTEQALREIYGQFFYWVFGPS